MEKEEKLEVCRKILEKLANEKTKIEIVEDIQGNYYSFVNNKIYLTNNEIKKNDKIELNPVCGELVTLCHECAHSIQNKWVHIANIVLSNISIILIIVITVMLFLGKSTSNLLYLQLTIISLGIIVRLLLELDAIKRSIKLAKEMLNIQNIEKVGIADIQKGERYIKRVMPIQLLKMVLDKIVFIIICICLLKLQ